MKPELTVKYFLSAGDCNAQGELSLPRLTANIIETATAHANSLNIGNPVMKHLGYGWILSRIGIEMDRYPKVNEEYSVTTWIESFNRHFSIRNFKISDSEGKPIGYSISVWMVMNWNTRENAGTSHLNLDASLISGISTPMSRLGKHRAIIQPGETAHNNPLIATEAPIFNTFRYSDLDFYRHVNTVRYVEMLLDCFSLEQMDESQVRRIELAFMREGRYGESVKLLRVDEDFHTSFALSDAEDGTALLSASLLRRPRTFS